MTNKERMLAGEIYDPADASILGEQTRCLERQYDYNATRPGESARRAALLKEMFLEIGEGCYIEPPLHANWGGAHVRLGDAVYANFGLTLVDDAEITIGSRTMIGPNVVIATGAPALASVARNAARRGRRRHARHPRERRRRRHAVPRRARDRRTRPRVLRPRPPHRSGLAR